MLSLRRSAAFAALLLCLIAFPAFAASVAFLDEISAQAACAADKSDDETAGPITICGDPNYMPCRCETFRPVGDPACYVQLGYDGEDHNVWRTGDPGRWRGFTCDTPQDVGRHLGNAACDNSEADKPLAVTCANPITTTIGNKFQAETDFAGAGLLRFVRYYNSHPSAPNDVLGPRWSHNYSARVELLSGGLTATVHRGDGRRDPYTYANNAWSAPSDSAVRLVEVMISGVRIGWELRGRDDSEVLTFDANGRLLTIRRSNGQSVTLAYSSGRLVSATDQAGRALTFGYDGSGRIDTITDPTGFVLGIGYDGSGRLSTVGSLTTGVRTYVYGETTLTAGTTLPYALTGIVDENGDRYASWGYDAAGMAVMSEHAGGAGRVEIDYDLNTGTSTLVTATGATEVRETVVVGGDLRRPAETTVSCTGCTTRSRSQTYDANGRLDTTTDELGGITDYDYDAAGLLQQRIDAANDTLGAKRRTEFDYDATTRLVTESRVYDAANVLVAKSTFTYNTSAQPLTASLVDPQTSAVRTTSYAYCSYNDTQVVNSSCPIIGLLKWIDGPLSGSGDRTTFAYRYADDLSGCATPTTFSCHRKGDLFRTFHPGGMTADVQSYDRAGRPARLRDVNSVLTYLEYDARGRLTKRTLMGPNAGSSTDDAVTTYAYDLAGNVEKVTSPDGALVEFDYDDARRLTAVEDGLGNRIEYDLDDAGNIFAEETRDTGGTLRRRLNRLFDGLGQLETTADASANPTDFAYDVAGRLDTVTDALGRVTENNYDALGRLRESIANTAGSGAQRPVTQIGYDALDRTTSVVDPKGLTTSYGYNGLGDLVQLVSPDTGTTTYGYDAAGQRTSATDARGVQSIYAYDGLGRVTGIDRPSAGQDVAFTLDTVPTDCLTGETYGNGRLGTMTDPSGSTKYCYDHRGNVVRKVQVVTIASTTRVVGYSYNHADALVAMTYPSGATVAYARDGNGRIVGVTVQPSAGATAATVISDVDYLPSGPISVLTFGNGRTLTRSYDLDYGIDAVTDSNTSGLSINLGLDIVGNVTSLAERKADGTTASRTVGYDAIDRLSSFNDGGTVVQGFTYDATGNRMSKTSGGSTAAYTYPPTSHLLTSGTGIRNYDAAGNGTYVAGRTYVYDDAGRRVRHILAGSTVREFAYNGHGERVARLITTSPANDQIMVYDEAGHLIGEYLKNGTRLREIVWMDDTPVAVLTTVGNSTYQYILTDHLNTPRQIVVPATNVTVWRWDIANTAFGDHAANQDPDGDGTNYGFFLRYPGQYYDEDSGLYYNFYRDYDPTSGRYLQSDPIGLGGGISTFAYVSSSPVALSDALGLAPGDRFSSVEDALRDLMIYLPTLSPDFIERGGWIYQTGDCVTYNLIDGEPSRLPVSSIIGIRPKVSLAAWHSHHFRRPATPGRWQGDNIFSGEPGNPESGDIGFAEQNKTTFYLVAPIGVAYGYDPTSNSFTDDIRPAAPSKCGCDQ